MREREKSESGPSGRVRAVGGNKAGRIVRVRLYVSGVTRTVRKLPNCTSDLSCGSFTLDASIPITTACPLGPTLRDGKRNRGR